MRALALAALAAALRAQEDCAEAEESLVQSEEKPELWSVFFSGDLDLPAEAMPVDNYRTTVAARGAYARAEVEVQLGSVSLSHSGPKSSVWQRLELPNGLVLQTQGSGLGGGARAGFPLSDWLGTQEAPGGKLPGRLAIRMAGATPYVARLEVPWPGVCGEGKAYFRTRQTAIPFWDEKRFTARETEERRERLQEPATRAPPQLDDARQRQLAWLDAQMAAADAVDIAEDLQTGMANSGELGVDPDDYPDGMLVLKYECMHDVSAKGSTYANTRILLRAAALYVLRPA